MTAPYASEAARRTGLRRATLHLILGVVALDLVAMGLFYALHIGAGPERMRTIFVVVWTFATAVTVAFLLKRVRQARLVTRPPVARG